MKLTASLSGFIRSVLISGKPGNAVCLRRPALVAFWDVLALVQSAEMEIAEWFIWGEKLGHLDMKQSPLCTALL